MKIKIVNKWLLVGLIVCAETVIQSAAAPHWSGNQRVKKSYEDERKEREFFKVLQTGDLRAIQAALAWGVNVNAIDSRDGDTALMKVVSLDCVGMKCDGVKILEALLDARANPDIVGQGAERWTVLEKAMCSCKTTMVRTLLDRNVQINPTALQLTCKNYGDTGEPMSCVVLMLINAYRAQLIRQRHVVRSPKRWEELKKELIKFIEPAVESMMKRDTAPLLYESDRQGLNAGAIALLQEELTRIKNENE